VKNAPGKTSRRRGKKRGVTKTSLPLARKTEGSSRELKQRGKRIKGSLDPKAQRRGKLAKK